AELSGRNSLTVESLVEDKTEVKKGDVICQLSAAKYEEALETKLIELSEGQKNKKVEQESLASQRIDNISNVKNASIALRKTRDALDRYLNEDSPRTKKTYITELRNAEDLVEGAEKKLSQSQKMLDENQDQEKRHKLQSDVSSKNKDLESKTSAREAALYKLKIFKQYTYPEKIDFLNEDVALKKRTLRKTIFNANSRLDLVGVKIINFNRRITRSKKNIETLRSDLSKLTIIAPVDGIINWGDPSRRHYSQQEEFRVGSNVRARSTIGTIPDLSKFQITAELPESYRSFVKQGLITKITNKALPDLKLDGQIKSISTVAKHTRAWDKKSPKVYSLVISTEEHDKRLMPGMSMYLEIVVECIKNKLYIPIEAVYSSEGKSFCRVLVNGVTSEREIETGKFSNDYIVIRSGIKNGDLVLLHRAAK
ncbi:MAG: HlyD family efflux transporter periplasmic adaptor subunit, partial [Lentisphaeraceae bacterium]|nr:HlyD family efflux transporter periplasmic adaptor subunit [Lentisphaeraceae bacterium]